MHLQLPTILALLPLILAAPMADHLTTTLPTPTAPIPGDVSILPVAAPPVPNPSATLQDLLTFCASGGPAASLPAVQQFCKLITGFAGAATGAGGGGLGGILPPIPGLPGLPIPPLPIPLPAGTGPILPV
ncbi:hypothetical protein IFR05_007385 [Cadophora sp. M221]|nr:hypothetical protein IFR05_007385 [Cadophora sp. M221]